MPNTIGSAKCSEEDQTKCELVGVGMTQSSSGAFEASYDLPKSLTANNTDLQALNNETISRRKNNKFKGTKTYKKQSDNTTLYWDTTTGRNL